mmetsp:Transcript_19191/g.73429  ORF Transcript_19191/g.73429 Transcript_19191/m.73429 type:complete len:200 (+) Transcript_19191:1583-2182(+)
MPGGCRRWGWMPPSRAEPYRAEPGRAEPVHQGALPQCRSSCPPSSHHHQRVPERSPIRLTTPPPGLDSGSGSGQRRPRRRLDARTRRRRLRAPAPAPDRARRCHACPGRRNRCCTRTRWPRPHSTPQPRDRRDRRRRRRRRPQYRRPKCRRHRCRQRRQRGRCWALGRGSGAVAGRVQAAGPDPTVRIPRCSDAQMTQT